jgi:lipoprotein-releasing system permease protein
VAIINTELFVARRIFFEKGDRRRISGSIINFAVSGIAIGLAIMILSVAIVTGFKSEIRKKAIGFGSHIQLENFDSNSSYQTRPIPASQPWFNTLKNMEGIKHIQKYATKPGIIKTDENIHGVVLKGVAGDFDWTFFEENLLEGYLPDISDSARSNDVLISKQVSSLLKLKIKDPLYMYFLNENSSVPRMRKFNISGIYKSNLEEFDRLFIIGDLNHVRRLNNWHKDEISGFEITIDDFNAIDDMTQKVRQITLDYNSDEKMPLLLTKNILSKYPQIFDWLNLLDMNVWVILALIIIVAGFNMVSVLLILILERTNMIGILKALGTENRNVRKVFIYLSSFLIGKGMLWGNILGGLICLLQYRYGIFKLDPESYYVSTVPIDLKFYHLILLNIGTILITVSMLILPSWFISKITPEKTIRFE